MKPWLARVLGREPNMETGFLSHPPEPATDADFAPGIMIGPYRLDTRLGEGGMGEVWRAARADDGPQRDVALKLPHPELLGGPFRQRFARERDVLASLSHPHIAQIYDAGMSAGGHPYLALELVQGEPITDACRAGRAGLHRRIELVCEVLDALMFAHQRLIVHRDIKPSNVLVTPEDGVKLLDFGIAKLLRPDGSDEFPLTQPAAHLATPGYAAPEQFSGGAITVATDIFAVGVVLFELCTGRRPFPRGQVAADASAAPLASSHSDAAASGAPEGRLLARLLRGDLDAVIAQAIALDPADRYGSAEAFARDLRRFLQGRPVSARRIGWATRTRKFVLRNKLGVALATVLVVTLALGIGAVAWQARRAERQAARATAIKDYVIGLFDNLYPHGGKPNEHMTAKALLDIGADRADAAFAHDPATEIELLNTLQSIYDVSDDADHAEKVGLRKLELQRALYGPTDPRVLSGTVDLVVTQVMFLDSGRARTMLDQIRASLFASTDSQSLPRALWLYGHATPCGACMAGVTRRSRNARKRFIFSPRIIRGICIIPTR
jgi:serine/threonine-protein kinase